MGDDRQSERAGSPGNPEATPGCTRPHTTELGGKRSFLSFMKRVLLTGLSGTGKSTVIRRLAALGYRAVDADTDEWSRWTDDVRTPAELGPPVEPGRDWVWREDRIQRLLSAGDAGVLFVGGCAENMSQFYPQFDRIILLSAPPEIIVQRLATRTGNPYGKRPDQVRRVLDQVQTIEPLLRERADFEIDTSIPVDQVVDAVLRLIQARD